jgi:hypothetical protein
MEVGDTGAGVLVLRFPNRDVGGVLWASLVLGASHGSLSRDVWAYARIGGTTEGEAAILSRET